METVYAIEYSEKAIVVDSVESLHKIYKCIEDTNNFILSYKKGDMIYSEVVITDLISAKVKTGEIKISSREGEEKSWKPY